MTRTWIAGTALMLALAGCGDGTDKLGAEGTPTPSATPTNTLAAACGRPGARVDLARAELPVTIKSADCDVEGVVFFVDDHKVAMAEAKPAEEGEQMNGGTEVDGVCFGLFVYRAESFRLEQWAPPPCEQGPPRPQ